jgi:hypothetical protein
MPSSESSQNVSKRHNKNLNSSKTSQQQSSESELNKSTSEQSAYQAKTNGDIQPTDSSTGLLNLTGVKTLLLVTALTCVCITGFMTRLFSVIRYESIIHEFDPWYKYTVN